MGKKEKILLMTLIGLFSPLGQVYGPLFVKVVEPEDKKFRKRIVWLELIVALLAMLYAVNSLTGVFQENIQSADAIAASLYPMMLYPLIVIAIAVCGIIYVKCKKG